MTPTTRLRRLRPALAMLAVGLGWNYLALTTPVSGAQGPAPETAVSERSPAR
ncbi:hypothetical protein ACFP3Q_17160 [Nocardioides sp. GCM10027113]|uniref:hypothetical protein n=1 Tax=unclassified Nocardioides TaxID=2615069 RepID=UPI003622E439